MHCAAASGSEFPAKRQPLAPRVSRDETRVPRTRTYGWTQPTVLVIGVGCLGRYVCRVRRFLRHHHTSTVFFRGASSRMTFVLGVCGVAPPSLHNDRLGWLIVSTTARQVGLENKNNNNRIMFLVDWWYSALASLGGFERTRRYEC